MTPAGHFLSPWHRRFPDRRLWAGRLRLWRVELAVRSASSTLLTEWIGRATAASPEPARLVGLPKALVDAHSDNAVRQTFAFLQLRTGLKQVSPPDRLFEPWPAPEDGVPIEVLRPLGVDAIRRADDWRTVPVVRSEAVDVVAAWLDERIQVFAADLPESVPLWELPTDVLPVGDI